MLTDAPRVQVTDAALDYLTYYTRFPEANTDGAPCSRPSARPHERSSPRRSLERVYVYVCVSRALRGGGAERRNLFPRAPLLERRHYHPERCKQRRAMTAYRPPSPPSAHPGSQCVTARTR